MEFLLPPTAPFATAASSSPSSPLPLPGPPSLPSNDSPVLPPLPSFLCGDFGFVTAPSSIASQDSLRNLKNKEVEKPPLSPKHPGRKARSRSRSRSASPSPQRSETAAMQPIPAPPPPPKEASPSPPLRPSFGTPRGSPVRPASASASAAVELDSTQVFSNVDGSSDDHDNSDGVAFHAVTAEEPIVLHSGSSASPSAAGSLADSPVPVPAAPPPSDPKKRERRGSFMGGWKLALKRSSGTDADKDAAPPSDAPVGVGSGGGWIYRRRGSFSSPRPPTAERAQQHKSYAQEYKEFRSAKAAANSSAAPPGTSSSASAPPTPSAAAAAAAAVPGTFAARAAAAGMRPPILQLEQPQQQQQKKKKATATTAVAATAAPQVSVKTSGSTRRSLRDKMRSVEARFTQKPPPPAAAPAIIGREVGEKELVGLDEAVRHMGLLEEQLKSGRPLSPPDSRDGDKGKENEKRQGQPGQSGQPSQQNPPSQQPLQNHQKHGKVAPLTIVKKNPSPVGSIADEEKGFAAAAPLSSSSSSSSSSGSHSAAAAASAQPAMPPGGRTGTKSHSPLRNQLDTSSQSSQSPPPLPPPQQQQLAKTVTSAADKGKAKEREGSIYSLSSVYPPPSDYFGRPRPSSGSTSPVAAGAPKPVAKLFVICCRCKYWHDLPSTMYRGMVENGGATRCPYCLHGMETSCCQGWVPSLSVSFSLSSG